jgi:hypothetical protein
MPSDQALRQSERDFVKQSSLYAEFLAEREEILRHKWLESERLGYDIGFERAVLDWIRKHRDGWRAHRRAQLSQAAIRERSTAMEVFLAPGPSRGRQQIVQAAAALMELQGYQPSERSEASTPAQSA